MSRCWRAAAEQLEDPKVRRKRRTIGSRMKSTQSAPVRIFRHWSAWNSLELLAIPGPFEIQGPCHRLCRMPRFSWTIWRKKKMKLKFLKWVKTSNTGKEQPRHFGTANEVKLSKLSKLSRIFKAFCVEFWWKLDHLDPPWSPKDVQVYLDVVDPKPPCSLSDPADWGQMGHWSVQVRQRIFWDHNMV